MQRAFVLCLTTLAAPGLCFGRSLLRTARRLPLLRRAMSGGLETLAGRADASWVRCLDEDPESAARAPNQSSRCLRGIDV